MLPVGIGFLSVQRPSMFCCCTEPACMSIAQITDTPAVYSPFLDGRYRVPGPWHRLRADEFGNGPADARVFQLDRQFGRYREEKLAARARQFACHVCEDDLPGEVAESIGSAVNRFVVSRLTSEYPELFQLDAERDTRRDGMVLRCGLTGEELCMGEAGRLVTTSGTADYRSVFDALACQVQEDMAVMRVTDSGNSLCCAHICMPSGWHPDRVVGGSFADLHRPVPGFSEDSVKHEAQHVRTMLNATDGLVRFVWGVQADSCLNHYPGSYQPAVFDPADARGWLRVERQTVTGFPELGMFVFTIRLYLTDLLDIRSNPALKEPLARALGTMSSEMLAYKGMTDWVDLLAEWLVEEA
jgi:hypothetical protein